MSKYASNKQNERVETDDGRFIPVLTGTPGLLVQLADALTKLGHQQIVSTIVEWIDDKNIVRGSRDDVRIAHIVNSLGRCKEKQAVEGLVKIFHGSHVHSEFMALIGLGNIQNKYAITGLLRGFLVSQRDFQMRAIYRMVSMDNKTIFDGLTLALSDANNFVRRKAMEFIAYYSDPKDQCLIEKLRFFAANDASEKARDTASQSLQKYERKLRYFDIPISTTPTNDPSPPSPPPLTAQERAEME